MIALEGIFGVFALISLAIVFWIKPKFADLNAEGLNLPDGADQVTGQI
jgi:hypothetical protein